MIEAFLRFHFSDLEQARRDALARRATGFLLVATTVVSAALAAAAEPLSTLVLGHRDTVTFLIAVLGLWAFTNLELAYGILRVDERVRAYATASLANVGLTIAASVVLVVGLGDGARGLLLGNYGASTVILLALWFSMRRRLLPRPAVRPEPMRTLLHFGLPTVPAEASVYALSIVDRYYIYHSRGPALAGLYSIAVKLAGAVAFIVRAFQYAWPPLAYSVSDDAEAARFYGLVTTYYVLVSGWVVAALALLGRWVLRLLTTHAYLGAYRALPWVALGWALYGLWVVFLVIAGRAQVTRRNFPASIVGLLANVLLLLVLVPAQIAIGDRHGLNTLTHQPVKVAAMEGDWETQGGQPLVLFAWPNETAERNDYEVALPKLGSLILTHSLSGRVQGLKEWPRADRPPVAIVFWTFRIMVAFGFAMLALVVVGNWRRWKGRLYEPGWFLVLCEASLPFGFVAVIAGWVTTEVGRQPWVVYGQMRTGEGVTPSLTGGDVLASLALYVVVYLIAFPLSLYYVRGLLRAGPGAAEPAAPPPIEGLQRPQPARAAAGTGLGAEPPP